MSSALHTRPLDPTPPRPPEPLRAPEHRLTVVVDVDEAHLANPLLAVSRMLASEARAHAWVDGDDGRMEISVALADGSAATRAQAKQWVRWVVHNAGVRGTLHSGD
jgi:hypothetical protein